MSQENVELVRGAIEAYIRGDLNRVAESCDDDFEFTSVLTAVVETSYRGKNAWSSYWADMRDAWEEWLLEDLEFFDGRDDQVVVTLQLIGNGKESGALVERRVGILYRLRGGKLWRARSYLEPDQALEAAGLPN